MGIWQQTRKMKRVIAVQRIFSCERRDGQGASARAAGGRRALGQQRAPAGGSAARRGWGGAVRAARLERDLTVGLRDLRQHTKHGLDEREEAQLACRHGARAPATTAPTLCCLPPGTPRSCDLATSPPPRGGPPRGRRSNLTDETVSAVLGALCCSLRHSQGTPAAERRAARTRRWPGRPT